MAGSVNRAILVGRLTADPEVRELGSGRPVMNFRLATNERWTDRETGQPRERAEFHAVVVMQERSIDALSRMLRKGALVYVEGKLQTRQWTDREGRERWTTEIMVGPGGEVTLLEGRGDDAGAPADRGGRPPSGSRDGYGGGSRYSGSRGGYGGGSGGGWGRR